jgi:hypothetical protein
MLVEPEKEKIIWYMKKISIKTTLNQTVLLLVSKLLGLYFFLQESVSSFPLMFFEFGCVCYKLSIVWLS